MHKTTFTEPSMVRPISSLATKGGWTPRRILDIRVWLEWKLGETDYHIT